DGRVALPRGRRARPAAAGDGRLALLPVRLLRPRLPHDRPLPAGRVAGPHPSGDPGGAVGEPVPLHRLPEHRRRRPGGRRRPGVHLIFTGEDLKSRTHPFFGTLNFKGFYQPTYWALATDRVRHVGDPVAIVVADSRRLAEDACELIEVDYQPLPPISTVEQALDAERAVVWPKSKTNVHYQA